jgi:hypothetical protein
MARRLALSLTVLLLGCSGLAHAVPAVSDSFNVTRTQLAYAYNPIAVGPGDTLYAYRPGQPRIYRSVNGGGTFADVYTNNTAPYQSSPFDLFVTAKGYLLYPTSNTGKVEIFHGNGSGALKRSGTLTFNCATTTPKATMWNAAEDTVGIDKLYVGEYGGAATDHCADIWLGTWADTGYVWTLSNDASAGGANMHGRHVHGIGVDPVTSHVFAMLGDRGSGYTNATSYLARSINSGATWGARPNPSGSAEYQMLTLGFSGTKRILGSDRGGAGETNFFAWTDDDSLYTKTDSLTSANPTVPWCYSKDTRSSGLGHHTLYVGTVSQSAATATPQILISRDAGATWHSVYTLAPLSAIYSGVYRMSKVMSTGEAFYFTDKPGTADDATYKFALASIANKTNWLIGVGADCDFSTIYAALEDTLNVDPGDTLTLKSGQHHRVINTPTLKLRTNMHVRGQSGVAADVVVLPLLKGTTPLLCDRAGIVLEDFTCRTVADLDTTAHLRMTAPFITMTDAGATLTLDNVDFRNVDANHTGAGTCIDAVADAEAGNIVKLVDCDFDSTSNTYASTGKGVVNFAYINRVVMDRCTFSHGSAARAPVTLNPQAEPTTAYDFILRNVLLDSNTSSGTSGGAIHFVTSAGSAETDTLLFDHCTFYKNTPATAANGQFYTSGNYASIEDIRLEHTIFYGDGATFAIKDPPSAQVLGTAKWVDTYLNGGANRLAGWVATFGDTLHTDPDFVTTAYDSTRKFMPKSCTAVGGSSCRITDDASYMGWKQPVVAAAVPALATPAWGAASTNTTIPVTWNATAYADSYQVRFGSACGSGSTGTPTAELADTLTVTPNAKYFWQVRAKECGGGWGDYADCWTFGSGSAWGSGHRPWDRIGHRRRGN